jgi:hypothetical protein
MSISDGENVPAAACKSADNADNTVTPDKPTASPPESNADLGRISPAAENSPVAKRWVILLLSLAALTLIVFYIAFFPKALVAQVSGVLGLAAALLALLGWKAKEWHYDPSISTEKAVHIAMGLLAVACLLLAIGLARPFRVRTLPGARVYIDGKIRATVRPDAQVDEMGMSTALIYNTWETHDFAAERRYFQNPEGEKTSSQSGSWFQFRVWPVIDLPLRACLGKGSEEKRALPTAEWTPLLSRSKSLDLNQEEDIGEAAFDTVLRAIDSLAGSEYPPTWKRIPLAVQCSPSVTLSHQAAVQNPFSPGTYLGVTVNDSVQLRIQLDESLPLPDRVVKPAIEFKQKLLQVLQINDSATSEELDKAIKQAVAPILAREAQERILSKLEELNVKVWLSKVPIRSLEYACLIRDPKESDIAEISNFAADSPSYEEIALQADEARGKQLMETFETLAVAAKITHQNRLYDNFYATISRISQNAADSGVRDDAGVAIKQLTSLANVKPCPLHGRTGRNPETGEPYQIPARKR